MSFATLPRELQLRILLYATQPPHGSLGQAPTLALVSRATYSIITELLFKHVRVTNVTTLRRIHAGLQANPALGELVQSIHIGPDEALPFRGWPLRVNEVLHNDEAVELLLKTTLPRSLVGAWVKPDFAFDIDRPQSAACHHHAILLAISSALSGLDVDPRKRGWSLATPARRIGVRAWALRLWQAQAALDLFLIEMLKQQQKHNIHHVLKQKILQRKVGVFGNSARSPPECETGICGHYPILDLSKRSGKGFSEESDAAQKYLYLSKEDLWRHLARQGGPAEHFDHLLLFARSRQGEVAMGKWEWHALREDLKGPHQAWFNEERLEGEEDASSISSDEADWSDEEPAHDSSYATVGKAEELLVLAKDVLARTPRIVSLSLSSFFHKALSGCSNTDNLLSLTLGPIVPWWSNVLLPISPGHDLDEGSSKYQKCSHFDSRGKSEGKVQGDDGEATMSRLVTLHVCGMITNQDARKIATQMPRLKDMTLEIITEYGSHVLEVVENLQGRSDQFRTSPPQQDRPNRYTEVRLRPEAMQSSRVPIPTAWLENRHVEGTLHRVRVMLSQNVVAHDPPQWEDEEQTMNAQYAEARGWWEQGLVGLGLYSELE